jgi:hypothetical protein
LARVTLSPSGSVASVRSSSGIRYDWGPYEVAHSKRVMMSTSSGLRSLTACFTPCSSASVASFVSPSRLYARPFE